MSIPVIQCTWVLLNLGTIVYYMGSKCILILLVRTNFWNLCDFSRNKCIIEKLMELTAEMNENEQQFFLQCCVHDV